jgi:hypothetical protein
VRRFQTLATTSIVVLCVCHGSAYSQTQQPTPLQTQVLKAQSVDMTGNSNDLSDETNDIRAIWKDQFDKILSERQSIAAKLGTSLIKMTDVFFTTFQSPAGRIILSATATPTDDCQSFSNIGLSSNLMTCPMRVALISNDKLRTVYSDDKFPFSIGLSQGGAFDNSANDNQTSISFDPVSKMLQSKLFSGPQSNPKPLVAIEELTKANPDNRQIKLSY